MLLGLEKIALIFAKCCFVLFCEFKQVFSIWFIYEKMLHIHTYARVCIKEYILCILHFMNPSPYTWQAGHGKGRLLGKDDSCERVFGHLHELLYLCSFLSKKYNSLASYHPNPSQFGVLRSAIFI